MPSTLRTIGKLKEPETDTMGPAMLATFSDKDGKAVTIQQTYLDMIGRRRPELAVQKRTMTPNGKMSGGAIQLFPAETTLIVAEGIETAIMCHEIHDGTPAWATTSATLLAVFEPPPEVTTLIIMGDNDPNFTGQHAAYALANRLYGKVEIIIQIPAMAGDWLDIMRGKGVDYVLNKD